MGQKEKVMALKNRHTEALLSDVRGSLEGRSGKKNADASHGAIEGKKLIVGKDIALTGTITECDSLVVEGTVEATLEKSTYLEVSETGVFRGKVQIDEAIISGLFEGDLFVRKKLIIKSTGKIKGQVSYGSLEVMLGGQIVGETKLITGNEPWKSES